MNKLLFLAILLGASLNGMAQVKLDLTYDTETEVFTVSALPEATYQHPDNMLGSAQVTLLMPAGFFESVNMIDAPGIKFEQNAESYAPVENPEFDYISFGLNTPGVALEAIEGELTTLFQFTLNNECPGTVQLIDNETDVFMPPNNSMANVGNDLTLLGGPEIDYTGTTTNHTVECGNTITDTEEALIPEVAELSVFPNPAFEQIQMTFQWEQTAGNAMLRATDVAGKVVLEREVSVQTGANQISAPVKELSAGAYFLQLETTDGTVVQLGRFVRG